MTLRNRALLERLAVHTHLDVATGFVRKRRRVRSLCSKADGTRPSLFAHSVTSRARRCSAADVLCCESKTAFGRMVSPLRGQYSGTQPPQAEHGDSAQVSYRQS